MIVTGSMWQNVTSCAYEGCLCGFTWLCQFLKAIYISVIHDANQDDSTSLVFSINCMYTYIERLYSKHYKYILLILLQAFLQHDEIVTSSKSCIGHPLWKNQLLFLYCPDNIHIQLHVVEVSNINRIVDACNSVRDIAMSSTLVYV